MSITVTTDIFCDLCQEWKHGVSLSRSIKSASRFTRKSAKENGWVYKKIDNRMRDICPDCQRKMK